MEDVVGAEYLSSNNLCLEDAKCHCSFDGKSNPTSQMLQWHCFFLSVIAIIIDAALESQSEVAKGRSLRTSEAHTGITWFFFALLSLLF